jgi:molecular chaperone DnaK
MADQQHTDKETRDDNDSIECGIDLGTTNSLCAWVTHVDAQSQPPIGFQFAQHRTNHRITPSVISVDPASDEILVGLDAVDKEFDNPRDTIHSIKRLMGRRFDDKEVVKLRRQVSYRIDRDEAGMAVVVLGGKPYTPIEISAMILRRIKADAEAHFRKKITHAVVAVPAYFDDNQRNATREAARLAGFFVKRIVSEPVAASYAYGHGLREGQTEKLLVFDMGGGTFDVTIIRAKHPLSDVRTHMGDMWLGGDDVDAKLLEAKRADIEKQFGVDPVMDPAFMVQLALEVRRAKEVICHSDRKNEGLRLNSPVEVGGNGGTARSVAVRGISVSREEVVDAARPLVKTAIDLVKRALSAAHLSVREIDRVILVGGSSYLIGVEDALRQLFPPERIAERQDPIAAVALGCGILAKLIIGVECKCGYVNDRLAVTCQECGAQLEPFVDRTHLPYGIEVKGGRFEEVLKKGTITPTREPAVRTFYTSHPNQVKIYMPVYQGEETIAEQNRLQGFTIVQLPDPKPVNTPVEVRMSVNKDRVLEIEVVCDGYHTLTALRPGDWSTSLQKELERVRMLDMSLDVIKEGERVLNEWQSAPLHSEKEQQVASRGRDVLAKLRELHWEWLLSVPISFLMTLSGEEGSKLPYVEALGHSLQARVSAALERYRVSKAGMEVVDQDSVERAIWDAIDALFRDVNGECLCLVLLFGRKDSPNPDHVDLAKDRDELDVILLRYLDTKRGGKEAAAQEMLDKARDLLMAISNRVYFKRVWESWYERREVKGLLSSTPALAPNVDTRTMKNRK